MEASGGISTPPPAANAPSTPVNGTDSGLDRVTPPVMVTLLIDTVGSLDAPKVPMVSTGPPPRIMVAADPAPRSWTLVVMVTPPAKVPGPMVIVSPSWAALTAAWMLG
jgi:hypothetical protein